MPQSVAGFKEIFLHKKGAKSLNIPIIHEDNHLLVVEKPPNILSQGDRTQDVDMLTLLKNDLKIRYNKPHNVYLGLVHRLDRPVGGVMVFAKTSKAAARLSTQIQQGDFARAYITIVWGKPKETGTLTHYLLKDHTTNIVSSVREGTKGAKKAISDYQVLDTADELSLVLVRLHTGRSHQIRVQFSASDHPIYNDHKYGTNNIITGQPIALWSHEISFKHPTLRDQISFTSSPDHQDPWSRFPIIKGMASK